MKPFKRVAFFAIMALLAVPAMAEEREFTTKDGTSIFGEVQDYNKQTDRVKFKTDEGKTIQIKAETLLDEDFIYVRDWDTIRLFMKNTHFRIYLDGPHDIHKWTKYYWYRPPGQVEPNKDFEVDFERKGYTIKVDNQTGYDLENLDLKYCTYYEQERMDIFKEEEVVDFMVRPSVRSLTILPNSTQEKFESDSVVIRRIDMSPDTAEDNKLRYLQGESSVQKGWMLGLVLRATLNTRSGMTAVREVRLPKDLSEEYAWVEPAEENMVWPDDNLNEREDTKKPPTKWEEMGRTEGDGDS